MPAYKHKFPKLKSPSILSPMAGVTDVAYRTLCKQYGAGMTMTEFLSAAAIVRSNSRTNKMTAVDPIEKPVGVQLFGANEEEVIAAAQALQKQFDVIDINCGCPAYKVIKGGAGSALLEEPAKIHKLVAALVDATKVPITVKIRAGIDDKRINAVEIAKLAQDAGASAIAVHGRTQKQGYSGKADWNLIAKVKDSLDIPVIGNGDVTTPEIFKKRIEESKVDAIMVARGAIGKPFLFSQINSYLQDEEYEVLTNAKQIDLFLEYLKLAHKYEINLSQVRIHAQSFTVGQTGAAKFRAKLVHIKTIADLEIEMKDYREIVANNEK